MGEKLLTKQQMADYFGVTTRTVERWVEQGLLQKIAIGNVVRFRPADREALVRANLTAG